jgi:hypothetical protein
MCSDKAAHAPRFVRCQSIRQRLPTTGTQSNALDRVEGRYAGPNTKLGISVVAVGHITDHYGQLVQYLRLSGIVPPFTQEYGLKVR